MTIFSEFSAFVIGFAGVLTAGSIIIGVLQKVFKIFDKARAWLWDDIPKRLENMEMRQLKNTVCNKALPLSERLIDGRIYLARGGNGAVKAEVEVIEKQYKEQLEQKQ